MLTKRMSLKLLLFSLVFITPYNLALGKVVFKDQLSFSMGMVNNGFSQSEDALDENKSPNSGSVSVISLDLSYEFFSERKKSWYMRFTGSGMAGEISKYYAVSGGKRYYFGADGASATFEDTNIRISTHPVFRYYAGWSVGAFSMIYEPGKEVRSDLGVEFGGMGGILYSANKKSAYKFELTALKGTGVETTSMNIQIFFGVSYFMNSLF